MVRPVILFISIISNPRIGGRYNKSGNIIIPPPIPSKPEKNPPVKPEKKRNT
jgi:hypothetical protein